MCTEYGVYTVVIRWVGLGCWRLGWAVCVIGDFGRAWGLEVSVWVLYESLGCYYVWLDGL